LPLNESARPGERVSIFSLACPFLMFPEFSKIPNKRGTCLSGGSPLMGGFDFRRCLVAMVFVSQSYRRLPPSQSLFTFCFLTDPAPGGAMETLNSKHI
jgi:hypothetical protein